MNELLFLMSQNQDPASFSKPATVDLASLVYTWKVIPVASALLEAGVPQLVPVDGSGVDIVQLSQQAEVDTDLLYRYMRFASSLGVFKELPNRHFAHNEQSKLLLPGNITFYDMHLFGSAKYGFLPAAEYFTQLKDPSVAAMQHALKMPCWQSFAKNPQIEKLFAEYMTIVSNKAMPGIVQNIKLPETGIIADVGGGYGHALLEFLKGNPKLTGIVYEQPTVCRLVEAGLKDPNPSIDSIYSNYAADVKDRVSVVGGSYTDGTQLKQIATADVFFFKWVFHNNNDAVCRQILAGMYQVMKPAAKIIICDCVFKDTPHEWTYQDTIDLCMSEVHNAKERTKNEWTKLLCAGEGYQYNISFGDCAIIGLWELDLITVTKKVNSDFA